MSSLSVKLKELREKKKILNKKWTQKYVADQVGVARETYTGYEAGTKTPPIETINRIADVFEVTTDYLLGRSDRPKLSEEDQKEYNELDEIMNKFSEEERKRVLNMIKAYAEMTHAPEDD